MKILVISLIAAVIFFFTLFHFQLKTLEERVDKLEAPKTFLLPFPEGKYEIIE